MGINLVALEGFEQLLHVLDSQLQQSVGLIGEPMRGVGLPVGEGRR